MRLEPWIFRAMPQLQELLWGLWEYRRGAYSADVCSQAGSRAEDSLDAAAGRIVFGPVRTSRATE
jgi:hypothetical protein